MAENEDKEKLDTTKELLKILAEEAQERRNLAEEAKKAADLAKEKAKIEKKKAASLKEQIKSQLGINKLLKEAQLNSENIVKS